MHPVSLDEVERLARANGAVVERAVELPAQLGRPGMLWTGVVLRLPDDGNGAAAYHPQRCQELDL